MRVCVYVCVSLVRPKDFGRKQCRGAASLGPTVSIWSLCVGAKVSVVRGDYLLVLASHKNLCLVLSQYIHLLWLVQRDPWGFQIFQLQTPSFWQPDQKWSLPSRCPISIRPQLVSLCSFGSSFLLLLLLQNLSLLLRWVCTEHSTPPSLAFFLHFSVFHLFSAHWPRPFVFLVPPSVPARQLVLMFLRSAQHLARGRSLWCFLGNLGYFAWSTLIR